MGRIDTARSTLSENQSKPSYALIVEIRVTLPAQMQARRTILIFDADDTLWETQSLYEKSKKDFLARMEKVKFARRESIDLFESIDRRNVERFGFSRRRFPQSMIDTYRALCLAHDRRIDRSVAQRIRRAGERVFQATPRLLKGARETLSKLRARGLRMVLATKGDRAVQVRRIAQSGLRQFFERVYVLPEKGAKEFRQIVRAEKGDPSRSWSIGNSIRSDINPALAAGLNVIWVPRETWIYEEERPTKKRGFHRAKSIEDVPAIVLRSDL